MLLGKIHNCPELVDYVGEMGFLPLLHVGVPGWSAEDAVDEDCRYAALPDGGWEWPLWEWKGAVVRESGCAYGKFFGGKAGFVSREWWPDFCNWRRSRVPSLGEGSVEEAVVQTLREQGGMITRELRAACGFTGPKMRGRFDAYVTRLQAQCRVVTEDFVYPRGRNGKEYGWGWALLSTPERLFGREACRAERSPEESRGRILRHLEGVLPGVTRETLARFV